MNNNSPLVNLSLLESLQGEKKADELDLFIPFLADILKEIDLEVVDKIKLQESLTAKFNVMIPLGALETLLIRAKNTGLLNRDNNQYFVKFDEVNKITKESDAKKIEIQRSIDSIVSSFLEYCLNEFDETIEADFGEDCLYRFIREHISIFVENLHSTEPDPNVKVRIKNRNYLMASFIKYLHDSKSNLVMDVSRIVKGTLLANYLMFADKTTQKSKFANVTVYLDTPIVLGILGWDGPTRKKSLLEFLGLIAELEVNVMVFDITVNEIRGVFAFWKAALEKREYHKFHEMTRQLFISRSVTPEQINTESVLLESHLKERGISVDHRFKLNERYCCDETKLEKFLRRARFRRPQHDISCISRVFNSRAGKSIKSFNEKFCIFITPNRKLEAISSRFFRCDLEKNSIQVLTSENWLATILWLKHPEKFSSLPFDMLLTDAYGALNSDDHFWESFLNRFKSLKSKGTVSEEDFNLVRWDNSLFGMVQHASVLDGDEIAEDDIYKIVESIKRRHIEEKESELEKKSIELKKSSIELESVESDRDYIEQRTNKVIRGVSHLISIIFSMVYGWVWSYGTYLFGPSLSVIEGLRVKSDLAFYSGCAGFLVIYLLALYGAFGGAVIIYRWLFRMLTTYLKKKLFPDRKC